MCGKLLSGLYASADEEEGGEPPMRHDMAHAARGLVSKIQVSAYSEEENDW
jgi:hypothetical protein